MVLSGCGHRFFYVSNTRPTPQSRKGSPIDLRAVTNSGCAWFWTADPDYIPPAPEEQLGPKCFENPEDSRCWDIWDGKLGKDRKNAK